MSMQTEGNVPVPPSWPKRVLFGRNPRRTLVRIVVLVAVCYVVFFSRLVLVPIKVDGISMLPTYTGGQAHFINRLPYLFHEPQRGDVVGVVPKHTAGKIWPSNMYLKRIIALPGETVAFHKGLAIINGKPLNEPYVRFPCDWEAPPEQLGPTDYYVVGDNRSMSLQDHTQGRPFRKQIIGKMLL
jgi:signal peptidase I